MRHHPPTSNLTLTASAVVAIALAAPAAAQVMSTGPLMSVVTTVGEPGAYKGPAFNPPYQTKFTFEIDNLSEDAAGNGMTSFTIGAGLLDGILDGLYESGNLWVASWRPVFRDHSVTFSDPLSPGFTLDPGYPGILSLFAATNITLVDGVATATASGNAGVTNRFNEVPIKVPKLLPQLEPVTLVNPRWRNGAFSAAFTTRSNRLYTVWINPDPRATNWTVLAQHAGDGKTWSFSDTNATARARFYRVQTENSHP